MLGDSWTKGIKLRLAAVLANRVPGGQGKFAERGSAIASKCYSSQAVVSPGLNPTAVRKVKHLSSF